MKKCICTLLFIFTCSCLVNNTSLVFGFNQNNKSNLNLSSVATFIATQDCEVGTKLTMDASWGVFQLTKGKKTTKVVPAGKRLIYGAHILSSPGMPGAEPSYKGTVGPGETVYVP